MLRLYTGETFLKDCSQLFNFQLNTTWLFGAHQKKLIRETIVTFLVELIGKFNPGLQEHLRRITSDEIHDYYLGKRIKNELITLMADKVKETILYSALQARYFSIILDCTPDQSHKEQMSIILRFVDVSRIHE